MTADTAVLYGCAGCLYYKGVEWRGDIRYVLCEALGYAPPKVDFHRGCGLCVRGDEGGRQGTLF
jgi:hypothetical protein